MNRRDFLRMLSKAAAVGAAGLVLPPERKIWQVPSNAPVGERIVAARSMPDEFPDEFFEWMNKHTHTTNSGPTSPPEIVIKHADGEPQRWVYAPYIPLQITPIDMRPVEARPLKAQNKYATAEFKFEFYGNLKIG